MKKMIIKNWYSSMAPSTFLSPNEGEAVMHRFFRASLGAGFFICVFLSMGAAAKGPALADGLYSLHSPEERAKPGDAINVVGFMDPASACERFYGEMELDLDQCAAHLAESYDSPYPDSATVYFYESSGALYGEGPDFKSDPAFSVELRVMPAGATQSPLMAGSTFLPDDIPSGFYLARPAHFAPYDPRLMRSAVFKIGVRVERPGEKESVLNSSVPEASDPNGAGNASEEGSPPLANMPLATGCSAAGSASMVLWGLLPLAHFRRGRGRFGNGPFIEHVG
jgi:hypothetical protein